jgi:hypothetical protein
MGKTFQAFSREVVENSVDQLGHSSCYVHGPWDDTECTAACHGNNMTCCKKKLTTPLLSQCEFWGFHWEHLAHTTLSHDEIKVEVG